MASSKSSQLRDIWQRIKNRLRKNPFRKEPEAPEDPYAYVTAPNRPRPAGRSAAAVAELPEE